MTEEIISGNPEIMQLNTFGFSLQKFTFLEERTLTYENLSLKTIFGFFQYEAYYSWKIRFSQQVAFL